MAGERVELRSDSGSDGTTTTKSFLDILHFHYPWVLLLIFLAAFVVNSILTAEPSTASAGPSITGPGGKPLPRSAKKSKEEREKQKLQDFSSARKLIFIYLSAGVILTFVGSAVNIIAHALTERETGWWCGESTAVSGNEKI